MSGFTLLQINAHLWCRKFPDTSGAIGLDRIPDQELERIAERGYDRVWLMGVWTTGDLGREIARAHPGLRTEYDRALPDWSDGDVIGSPFAVKEYRVSPSLGGPEAIKRLRGRLSDRGLGLVLDFVPNHTARDHAWVSARPELYVVATEEQALAAAQNYFTADTVRGPRRIAHGRDPYFDGWTDTAQLDFRSPQTQDALIEALEGVAAQCDGVRCDMAMLCLEDVFASTWSGHPSDGPRAAGTFWSRAIERVRSVFPSFLFIAEAYWGTAERLWELGFDAVYDKGFYDALRSGDAGAVDRAVGDRGDLLERGLRFLENHDEERAARAFPWPRCVAAAVAALTLPGGRLFQMGQEEGEEVRLPVQLGRSPAHEPDGRIAALYEALLPVVTSPALRTGRWRRLRPAPAGPGGRNHETLFAWVWTAGREAVFCAANLSDRPVSGRVRIAMQGLGGRRTRWRDVLDGSVYDRDGDELLGPGLFVSLESWMAHVWVLEEREVRSSE
jgi:hypothetical protein